MNNDPLVDHLVATGYVAAADAVLAQREAQSQWCLLGWSQQDPNDPKRYVPTYACPQCWRRQVTLVSPGAVLPTSCRVCAHQLSAPASTAKETAMASALGVKAVT